MQQKIKRDSDLSITGQGGEMIRIIRAVVLICFLMVPFLFVSLTGCNQTQSTYSYPTATLTHGGFDFLTGTATNESGKYDGETISWNPDGVITTVEGTTYTNYGSYFWWRASYPLDSTAHQKHIGAVDLSTISSAPSTWDSGSKIYPLIVGHSYVVKCTPEGYAKFNVTSVGTSGDPEWSAKVQYYFISGSNFDK